MSAILGQCFLDGRAVERQSLERMSRPLTHRAPGGWHLTCNGPVGLGGSVSSRLENPTLSTREVPALIVADTRLDNRQELLMGLGLPDRREVTDELLILGLYLRWGTSFVDKLVGDFAFALWDSRERFLICARDPFGVRPLYYYAHGSQFAFASEIKGLLALSEIPKDLDEVQVGFHLDRVTDDPERTVYRGIRRLPAAHWLAFGPGGLRKARYWSIDTEREVRHPSDGQYEEEFRHHFDRAVRVRLTGSNPIGSALSGGLDSSSVVCTARKLLAGRPLLTLSCVFPSLPEEERKWNDEALYIDEVARLDGIVPHRIRGDLLSPLTNLDNVLAWHDGPNLGFNMFLHHAMYECAKSQGIRVLMDGLDGDTVVNHGLGWLASLAAAGEWTALGEQIRHLGRRHGVSLKRYLDPWVYPPLLKLARAHHWMSFLHAVHQLAPRLDQSRQALLLRTLRRLVAQSRKGSGSKADLDRGSIIDPEFARRIELQERERALRELPTRRGDTGRIMHADAVEGPILQYFLEVANNAASIHDVEPSYPFLDRPLVEYCVALPAEQKLRDGWTRWILRRSMEGVLPSKVQWRVRKGRLVYNFLRTLRVRDGRILESCLFETPTVLDPYVRMDMVRVIYDRFMEDSTIRTRNEDGLVLFQLATLSRWLRLNPVS